ncbi:glycosyltransferase family 2 protein [Priestia megaterium]|uniref:glycosyltransferase family 2 protein n=1 Tax=Priestia megaterium TaxID=1404 RepID=UPI000BF44B1B|nr:glycosyltransferase family A protein [Priestia megaterium]PFW49655.1 hypothetical protein COL17_17020 [Priestia megaterium]
MAKVTIVVPIYNVGKYIKKCMDSLINQTFEDFEVILVNDGSTDESGSICDEYEKIDKRIRVIHTPNQGSGEARNLGMDKAKGDYIFFCDPDDWIELDLIEDNYRLASENNADIIFFGVNNYMYNSKKGSYVYVGNRGLASEHLPFRQEFPKLYKSGLASAVWNKLYKLSYLKRHNCKFPRYTQGQDWSFNLLVYRDVSNVIYNNKNYYNYVKYENNTAVTRYNKDKPYIRERLFEEFKSLLDYWGIDENCYQELLYKCLLGEVLSESRNNFHLDSPDKFNEKYKKSKKLLNNKQVIEIIGNYKNEKAGLTEKILSTFIRRKFVIGIMLEAYSRQIFRSNFKSVVYNSKNFLGTANKKIKP